MNQLDKIIEIAMNEVPYYKDNINNDFSNISEFPILTKDIVQNMQQRLVREKSLEYMNRDNLVIQRTSGTTGQYLKIYWNNSDITRSMIELYHIRKKYYNIMPNDKMCYFFTTNYIFNTFVDGKKFIYNISGRQLGISKELLGKNDLKKVYAKIKEFSPVWMVIQPSVAFVLAKYIHDNELERIDSLEYIEFTGEMLTRESRSYIQNVFKCKTNNQYGANEFNSIACEHGDGKLHVNKSNVYVEVLDENENMLIGKEGDIYVTTLTNTTMPLIRYKIGDRGILYKEGDELIIEVSCGRSSEFVDLIDSSMISPYVFLKSIENINETLGDIILQFQIVQKAVNDFKVSFIVGRQYAGWEKTISERFIDALGVESLKNAKWEINLVDQILLDINTQKHNYFINEMRNRV